MAKEITVRSTVKFMDTGEKYTMEEVNANPELRAKFDERLRARLEEGIPNCESYMKSLMAEAAIGG